MKRVVLLAIFIAVTATASAQELDIFDVNDFVDPRALGAEVDQHGFIRCNLCRRFAVSRLILGNVDNYVDNLTPTDSHVLFGQLATSLYSGLWQFNLKASDFASKGRVADSNLVHISEPAPHNKFALQLGRYWGASVRRGQSQQGVLRAELTWSIARYREFTIIYPQGILGPNHNVYSQELGLEVDSDIPVFGHALRGSLVFVSSTPEYSGKSLKDWTRYQRASYVYRFPRLPIGEFFVDSTMAAGAFGKDGRWRGLTAIPSIEIVSPRLFSTGLRVHAKYEPNIQREGPVARTLHGPESYVWQKYNQYSVFVDKAIFNRVF